MSAGDARARRLPDYFAHQELMSEKSQIAVIGAGFSGVVTATHLLRKGCSVTLINRSGRMARGVAYGTNTPAHVLNVPAGRMSAFPDDEDSFLRFVRERDQSVTGGSFVSRSAYGEYLDQILADAERNAPAQATLQRIVGHVADIDMQTGDSASASVTLADGRCFNADRVVLALGNFAPADPPVDDRSFYSSARYVRDPWLPGALDSVVPEDSILLIGTGLTMYDIALELDDRGVREPIHAISRRGLLAQPHRAHGHPPAHENFPDDLNGAPTILSYLRAVRSEIAAHSATGGDWRDVIASLRPATPALWQALSEPERARFVRHLLPFWDVHRHRAAPGAAAATAQLMRDGRLVVAAGRIIGFEEGASSVKVTWRPRGAARLQHREFARVINCTGPSSNLASAGEHLVEKLIERGLLTTDALRLGVRVSPEGALIAADGTASDVIFYVGPLLRAEYWEATAVPELRVHAARLAAHLCKTSSRASAGH